MSDSMRDKAEGAWDKAKGQAKEAWGDLTNDDQKRAEGQVDQAKGEFKERKGDVKDNIDDAFNRDQDNR